MNSKTGTFTDPDIIFIMGVVKNMIEVKRAADSGDELVSNQGQALDGYSELANYRSLIEKIENMKIDEQ